MEEVLGVLEPLPGEIAVDCTVGWAGHAVELLRRIGPEGRLVGFDLDAENLARARERLAAVGSSFALHHGNFAGLASVLAAEGLSGVDLLVADLGMSSMQVDDVERGFSYVRDGPLDMRMDRSRGRSAAEVLTRLGVEELQTLLEELGDEPEAERIAAAVVAARKEQPILRTTELAQIILAAMQDERKDRAWRLHPAPQRWNLHPAARTFQALRIFVNRELANLEHLLRTLPGCLNPGGRAAILSFHSGEDRRVKAAFRDGLRVGIYSRIAAEPIRASATERVANPRSRSAKLRWAQR